MTARDKLIQIICGTTIVVCLILSGALATQITAEAGKAQLVYTDVAAEGDPPAVAAGIAMGAFRGLFVNYLWLRANRLKEEGKFYEAIELSSAITKLQPRFPRVWAFHAWNMAYNISVATKTPQERWQWVQAGVNLLRDKAIPLNPNDVLLYKELAWIFVHKIQGFSDDANRYYKKQIAHDWNILLGAPPPLPESNAEAIKTMQDWFRPIVDAPQRLTTLIEREKERVRTARPPDEKNKPVESRVEQLVGRLKKEAGLELDFDLLRLIAYRNAYSHAWYADSGIIRLAESDQNAALEALLADPELKDAWDQLIPFVRKQVIEDKYHMNPYVMMDDIARYGPLDFRHPAAHALYWASLGVEEALERKGVEAHDTLNTDRITMHAMQELWRSGTIFYDLVTDEYLTLQNLHYTDTYGDIMEALANRAGIAESKQRTFTLYRAGYENFLKDVIRAYYRMGDKDTAQRYYDKYTTWEGRTTNDAYNMVETELPLDDFVMKQLEEDRLTIPYVFASEVFGALTDAYIRGLLGENPKLFAAQFQYAKKVHEHYFKRHDLEEVASGGEQTRMEFMPRDFSEVAALVLQNLITSGTIEPGQASRIFLKAPDEIQKLVFDSVAATMAQRGMPKSLFDQLFPEPVGMADFRKLRQALKQQNEADIKSLELQQQ